jgi:type VI secretion system protein VasD
MPIFDIAVGNFRNMVSHFITCLTAAVLATGCAVAPKTFEIRGEADPVINRDAIGKPLSVAIRVYQLSKADEFSKLTFDTLASGRPETELLGNELLERHEVILVPGGTYTNTEKLRDETKYVGVVGFFRQPDSQYWRFLVEAEKVRKEGFAFKVQDCYLKLSAAQPYPIPGQLIDRTPYCGAEPPVLATPPQARGGVSQRQPGSTKSAATDKAKP